MDRKTFDEIKDSLLVEFNDRKDTFTPKSLRNFFNFYRGFLLENNHIDQGHFDEVAKLNSYTSQALKSKNEDEIDNYMQWALSGLQSDIEALFYKEINM